jgi:hypothetical protein
MSQRPLFNVKTEIEVDKEALRAIISHGVEEYLSATIAQRVSLDLSQRIAQQGVAVASAVGSTVTQAPRLLGSEAASQPAQRQEPNNEDSDAASSSAVEASTQNGANRSVVDLMRIKTEPASLSLPSGLRIPNGNAGTALQHSVYGTAENREPDEFGLTGDGDTDVDIIGDDESAPPEDFEAPPAEQTPMQTQDDPFQSLPDDWKAWYGEVVWCRWTDRNWYPACIADPSTATGEPLALATKWIGRKHLAFFYPAQGYDVVSPETIRLFVGTSVADFARGEHLNRIVPGILIARYELMVERKHRVAW